MTSLRGCRVLLVEDESLVAMMAEDYLADLGCDVVLAMRLEAALKLAREADLHAAVLDVNLGEGSSYPIAQVLRERNIPFLFATGYGANGVNSAYRGIPVLQKPYGSEDLSRVLEILLTHPRDGSIG